MLLGKNHVNSTPASLISILLITVPMEPLTAFSLVCGVIQVVDFSTKTLLKCKEFYQEGSLSEYQELEDLTNHLVDVRDKLELTTGKQNAGVLGAAEDQSLLEVAGQCSKTAEHLVRKCRSLKIEEPRKKGQAVLKTFKLLWGKGELRDIQRRLDGHRNVLDTQILIVLRYVCVRCPPSSLCRLKLICPHRYENRQRLDLASLQHSKGFQKLDQKIQDLINIVSQEPKSFEELKDLIVDENRKIEELKDLILDEKKETKENISSGFREQERCRAKREQHTRLLESLWFAEILYREETIADAHRKTFGWIFDRSGQAVRPWNNFVAWLENGEGIYWISGKAGSGKSTLMNFLCQDERTKDGLERWSGRKDILMAKFFFWSAGTMMQKNFDGFLRSLLWQISRVFPDMDILPSTIGPGLERKGRRTSYSHGSIGVWTKRRLQETLHEAISKLENSCYLCFFIDGLDEFDDDKDDLIDFVLNLVSNAGVKVCLSSRPDKEFQDAFGSSATLRLQDLTCEDIRRYVNDSFQKVPQLVSMALKNEYEMNKVKGQIVDRAEGVFLWVSLAVKDQIRGLRNDDSPEQLQERLARLPNEIEGIYTRMLDRIDKTYLREASLFLKIALCVPELSVLGLALASYSGLEDMLSSADEISEQQIISLCRSTRNKVTTRCVGLLEVHQDPASRLEPIVTDVKSSNLEIVGFVHRTAVDFLKSPGPGKAFLDTNSPPGFDPQFQYLKAALGRLRLTEELILRRGIERRSIEEWRQHGIDWIMENVAELEDSSKMPQVTLCELIDRTMSNLDHRHPDWSLDSNWCTRWGQLAGMKTPGQDVSCSQSSQQDVTFPATSPITNLGNRSAAQTDSKTFLCFAASHGLSLYVKYVLDRREKRVGSDELDNLLCCSTFGFIYGPFPLDFKSGPLILIAELVSRGANPNVTFMGETLWETFLGRMAEIWSERVSFDNPPDFRFMETLALATIAFIEHGADLGTSWSGTINFGYSPFTWPFRKCSFHLQASALFILKLCMMDGPEVPRISKICDARGAVAHSRCTTIKIGFEPGDVERPAERFNLSEQESTDFVKILKLCSPSDKDRAKSPRLSEFLSRLRKSRAGGSSPPWMHTSDA